MLKFCYKEPWGKSKNYLLYCRERPVDVPLRVGIANAEAHRPLREGAQDFMGAGSAVQPAAGHYAPLVQLVCDLGVIVAGKVY